MPTIGAKLKSGMISAMAGTSGASDERLGPLLASSLIRLVLAAPLSDG